MGAAARFVPRLALSALVVASLAATATAVRDGTKVGLIKCAVHHSAVLLYSSAIHVCHMATRSNVHA